MITRIQKYLIMPHLWNLTINQYVFETSAGPDLKKTHQGILKLQILLLHNKVSLSSVVIFIIGFMVINLLIKH